MLSSKIKEVKKHPYKLFTFTLIFAAVGTLLLFRSLASPTNPPGDLNNDNTTNVFDLSILLTNWNQANRTPAQGDLNNDTITDIFDLSILLTNWGRTGSGDGSPEPNGPGGLWTLKFRDEFSGSSLDLSKWRPNWLAGTDTALTPPINSLESGCYDPAQVSVGGGFLTLSAVAVTPGSRPGCVVRGGTNASYASGIVTSRHDYTFTYGYFEARIWLPPGSGLGQNWAAFWADGTGTWPTTGEIDVMEVLSNHIPCWHFHYQDSNNTHQGPGGCPTLAQLGSNYSGWHVFGAEWEAESIKYYYDGQQVGQVTTGVTSAPMFLIANYAVSASGTPPIIVPQHMLVDYIRHWQR